MTLSALIIVNENLRKHVCIRKANSSPVIVDNIISLQLLGDRLAKKVKLAYYASRSKGMYVEISKEARYVRTRQWLASVTIDTVFSGER